MALAMFTIELIHYECIWHQPIRSLHYLINAASMLFTWIKFNCSFAGIRICTFFFCISVTHWQSVKSRVHCWQHEDVYACLNMCSERPKHWPVTSCMFSSLSLSLSILFLQSQPVVIVTCSDSVVTLTPSVSSSYCYPHCLSCNFNSINPRPIVITTHTLSCTGTHTPVVNAILSVLESCSLSKDW